MMNIKVTDNKIESISSNGDLLSIGNLAISQGELLDDGQYELTGIEIIITDGIVESLEFKDGLYNITKFSDSDEEYDEELDLDIEDDEDDENEDDDEYNFFGMDDSDDKDEDDDEYNFFGMDDSDNEDYEMISKDEFEDRVAETMAEVERLKQKMKSATSTEERAEILARMQELTKKINLRR